MGKRLPILVIEDHPATARARLIAARGYDSSEDLWRSYEAGFNQYLIQPVDPAALQELLASMACRTSPPRQPGPGGRGRLSNLGGE